MPRSMYNRNERDTEAELPDDTKERQRESAEELYFVGSKQTSSHLKNPEKYVV